MWPSLNNLLCINKTTDTLLPPLADQKANDEGKTKEMEQLYLL